MTLLACPRTPSVPKYLRTIETLSPTENRFAINGPFGFDQSLYLSK
jgi:hypothetical protein